MISPPAGAGRRAGRPVAERGGEIDRDRAAERMAVDEAPRRIGLLRDQPVPGDVGVLVHRLLRRHVAIALAEAAIVDRQHRKAEVAQLLDAEQLAGQAPARAVQVQHRRRIGLLRRPPPGMDVLSPRRR